ELVERPRDVGDVTGRAEQLEAPRELDGRRVHVALRQRDVAAVVPRHRRQPVVSQLLGRGDAFVQRGGRLVETVLSVEDRAEVAQAAGGGGRVAGGFRAQRR